MAFSSNASNLSISPIEENDWVKATILEGKVKFAVKENKTVLKSDEVSPERSASFNLEAGKRSELITITQAGSDKPYFPFVIKAEKNGLQNDIIGTLNLDDNTIRFRTTEWIANVKELIANFDLNGDVSVDGVLQVSGESEQSYMTQFAYTVKKEDDTEVKYTVIPDGPMFTGLPVVIIFIDEGKEVGAPGIPKKEKLPAKFNLRDVEDSKNDFTDELMTIRGRGNSTFTYNKKPYRIDFPSKTSLFGLPKAKKWVFLANYLDPTFLTNNVAFELGRLFGMRFNHSSIHVEMFVNGTYRGNYEMSEQKEIGKGRVDIDVKVGDGFYLELDSYYDEDFKFKSEYFNLPVMVQAPSLKNESEMQYIKDYFNEFCRTLQGNNFPNDDYEKYTDVESLINYLLVTEIVRNYEVEFPRSVFLYKESGEGNKIEWGPLWDYEVAYGLVDFNAKIYFVRFDKLLKNTITGMVGNRFFKSFFEIPSFKKQFVERWKEMKPKVESHIFSYIDEKAKYLKKSQSEDIKIPGYNPGVMTNDYDDLINQMKTWLRNRIDYLDKEFEKY